MGLSARVWVFDHHFRCSPGSWRRSGQRSILPGYIFTSCVNIAIDTHIYYLPFYFQAVKGTSAQGSGIHILPYSVSAAIAAVTVESCVSYIGLTSRWCGLKPSSWPLAVYYCIRYTSIAAWRHESAMKFLRVLDSVWHSRSPIRLYG